jgi:hypothetical protein
MIWTKNEVRNKRPYGEKKFQAVTSQLAQFVRKPLEIYEQVEQYAEEERDDSLVHRVALIMGREISMQLAISKRFGAGDFGLDEQHLSEYLGRLWSAFDFYESQGRRLESYESLTVLRDLFLVAKTLNLSYDVKDIDRTHELMKEMQKELDFDEGTLSSVGNILSPE